MDLFELIISPFIFIIEKILLFGYSITNNYGWGIILLSFSISLLLLPVFILIEKAKKKDDTIKAKMQPLIDEIKRCYKGQERYYYLKTLNRQFSYSPFRAMIPILSLLLQIPFFIAAYQYLEQFEPLKGIAFGFIGDLSQPDKLFGGLNFLPIAMTVVNLLTAYFYTRNGSGAERKQMLIVAGIFLVLLFNLPSGLVLYWTMNNVFSFFRLFVTNAENFKFSLNINYFKNLQKKVIAIFPNIKVLFLFTLILVFVGLAIFTKPSSLLDLFKVSVKSISASFVWSFIIAIMALTNKQKGEFNSLHNISSQILKNHKSLFISLVIITVSVQLNWALQYHFNDIVQRILGCLTISFTTTIIFGWFGYIVDTNNLKGIIPFIKEKIKTKSYHLPNLKPLNLKVFISLFIAALYFHLAAIFHYKGFNNELLLISLSLTIFLQATLILALVNNKKYKRIYFTIFSLLIGSQIAISIKEFTFLGGFNNVVLINTIALLNISICISLYAFIYKIQLPKLNNTFKLIYFLSCFYIAGLVFFWNPMIVYSSLPESFSFPAIKLLYHNSIPFLITIAFAIIVFIIAQKKRYIAVITATAIALVLFLYSAIIPLNLGTLEGNLLSNEKNLNFTLDFYLLEIISTIAVLLILHWLYKKKKESIILASIVLLNIFLPIQGLYLSVNSGSFFSKNKASSNTNKNSGSPTIQFSQEHENIVVFVIDGAQGWYMNDIIQNDSLISEKYRGFTWYPNTISTSNFTYASIPAMMCGEDFNIANLNKDTEHTIIEKVTKATLQFRDKIQNNGYHFTSSKLKFSNIKKSSIDTYIPEWNDDWAKKLSLGKSKEIWYTRLWENALLSSAPLFVKPRIYNNRNWLVKGNFDMSSNELNKYHFVKALPKISSTNSDKKNFIYLHSMFTHAPWELITSDNKLIREAHPYDNQLWFTQLFANWIKWMQDNNVYDNTKIILVADHGPSWWHYHGKKDTDWFPVENFKHEQITITPILRLNPLLMVKDFNKRDSLKEDWQLMSNADTYAIAFDDNDPRKTDSLKNRTLKTYYTVWHTDLHKRTDYKLQYAFEVKDTVYNMKNWTNILNN